MYINFVLQFLNCILLFQIIKVDVFGQKTSKKKRFFFCVIISFYPLTIYFCHNFAKINLKNRSFWSFPAASQILKFLATHCFARCYDLLGKIIAYFQGFFGILKRPKSRILHLRYNDVIHLMFRFIYVQSYLTVLSFKCVFYKNYLKMYRSGKDYTKHFFQSASTVQLAKRLEVVIKSVQMELLILI